MRRHCGPGRTQPSDARDDDAIGRQVRHGAGAALAPGPGRLRELRPRGDAGGARGHGQGRPRTRATARSRGGRSTVSSPTSRQAGKLPPFGEGVGDRPEVKVLYVHGIGTHVPGRRHDPAPDPGQVAGARRPRAAAEADRDRQPELPEPEPGRDQRHAADRRAAPAARLLFYELTWSPITQPDKDLLAFDKEQDYVLRRAAVNQAMRSFVNDVAPDPLAYAGPEARADPGRGHASRSAGWSRAAGASCPS